MHTPSARSNPCKRQWEARALLATRPPACAGARGVGAPCGEGNKSLHSPTGSARTACARVRLRTTGPERLRWAVFAVGVLRRNVEVGPPLTEVRPKLLKVWPKIGKFRAIFGRLWALCVEFRQIGAKLDPSTKFGRNRHGVGQIRAAPTGLAPESDLCSNAQRTPATTTRPALASSPNWATRS